MVDKDERSGQLTLLSRYILASGSYFGNYFYSTKYGWAPYYDDANGVKRNLEDLLSSLSCNQAWSESTARAFLNNLERFDLGGDIFNAAEGLSSERRSSEILSLKDLADPSNPADIDKTIRVGKLLPSIGFSNSRYWTNLSYANQDVKYLVDNNAEFKTRRDREENDEVYYQRVKLTEPHAPLARNGFLDETFSVVERARIVPKVIPGEISHRWPDNEHFLKDAQHVEGTIDKVWIPSVEELSIKAGVDWAGSPDDSWSIPSELY